MKDRIETEKFYTKDGKEMLRFNLHTADKGILWLRDVPFAKGVREYFYRPRAVAELHEYRHGRNKNLNRIIDRMPAYIKYARENAPAAGAVSVPDTQTVFSFAYTGDRAA